MLVELEYVAIDLENGERIYGIIYKKIPGKFRRFIDYNEFGNLEYIPAYLKITAIMPESVEKWFSGSLPRFEQLPDFTGPEPNKYYFTRSDYKYPYVVRIYDKCVDIYELPDCYEFGREYKKSDHLKYTKLVKSLKYSKIWIPDGHVVTEELGYYYTLDEYRGNTILLQIGKFKFVYISTEILEFTIKDKVEKYYSLLGNKYVPYPVVVTKKYVYNLYDGEYTDKFTFEDVCESDFIYARHIMNRVIFSELTTKCRKFAYKKL